MNIQVLIDKDIPSQYRNGRMMFPEGQYGFTLEWPSEGTDLKPVPFGIHVLYVGWSNRFQKYMPHVQVDGRAGIEIHGGNFVKDSTGCTLLGKVRISDSEIAQKETDELVKYLQTTAPHVSVDPEGDHRNDTWGGHVITYKMAA